MSRTRKFITIILTVIGLTFIGLCGWGYRLVTRSLPQAEGIIMLPGLSVRVKVFRDGYHVPHILARNSDDLFLAQGFITAQDRFWQMEYNRRRGGGRLSEILGAAYAGSDTLMRTLGLYRTAQNVMPQLSADSRRAYEQYTKGVNQYLQIMAKRLPVEFNLLGYQPEPWSIADCIVCFREFFWRTGEPWQSQIIIASLLEKLGTEKAKHFLPDRQSTAIRQWWQGPVFSAFFEAAGYASNPLPDPFLLKPGHNWVVSGDKSGRPGALLATAPCLPIEIPPALYENHLSGSPYNVTGFSIPGFPGVLMGQNHDIAWSISRPVTDDKKIFLENDSPPAVNEVDFMNETIAVRMGDTLSLPVQVMRYGPMLPISSRSGGRSRIALSWSGHNPCDEAAIILELNRADSWGNFRGTLSSYNLFPLRFLYGDRWGNIGIQDAGSFHKNQQFLPENPADRAGEQLTPFSGLLSITNPPAGYCTDKAETGKMIDPAALHSPSTGGLLPCRASRLLEGRDGIDIRQMKTIQSDNYTDDGIFWRGILTSSEIPGNDPHIEQAIEILTDWDGRMKTGSSAAALYSAFITELARQLLLPDLGDTLFDLLAAMDSVMLDGISALFQSNVYSHKERQAIIGSSLKTAMAALSEEYGQNSGGWSWGAMHQMDFKHILGGHSLLKQSLNLGPFQIGGDGSTLIGTGYSLADPYHSNCANTARMVLDTSHPDNSVTVLAPGQSGHALDEHYRDQIQLYLGDMYHATLMDTSKIRKTGWKQLNLQPDQTQETVIY